MTIFELSRNVAFVFNLTILKKKLNMPSNGTINEMNKVDKVTPIWLFDFTVLEFEFSKLNYDIFLLWKGKVIKTFPSLVLFV